MPRHSCLSSPLPLYPHFPSPLPPHLPMLPVLQLPATQDSGYQSGFTGRSKTSRHERERPRLAGSWLGAVMRGERHTNRLHTAVVTASTAAPKASRAGNREGKCWGTEESKGKLVLTGTNKPMWSLLECPPLASITWLTCRSGVFIEETDLKGSEETEGKQGPSV